jgi:hypothetical protein
VGLAILKKFMQALIPKGPRPFFLKNTPNLPFLSQEAQMNFFYFFVLSIVGSCPTLLGEHVQKSFLKVDHKLVFN